jgi:transposase-like protein/IS1 family transposase
MPITIGLKCPRCHSGNIVRNRKKSNGTQNYLCKDCGCQFTSDHEKTCRGCLSGIAEFVKIMPVRGAGIRDISAVPKISVTKALKILTSGVYTVQPKEKHYDCLEIDEFWTYAGEKKNTVRLIYAYHRESGEIAGYVWGKRDLKTAKKPLRRLGITLDTIATDDWDSFLTAFAGDSRLTGKALHGRDRRE